jgi:hypothetical protein
MIDLKAAYRQENLLRPRRHCRGTCMASDIEIYVSTHKESLFPADDGYIPIHAGKALSNLDLAIIGDDTGENISGLNPYFCEISVLYWMRNNTSAAITGLVHYRRYFAPREKSLALGPYSIAASSDFDEVRTKYDLIVANPIKFLHPATGMPISNEQQFSDCTIGMDLALTREAIESIDKSYVSYWDFVMRSNSCSLCNMMVGKTSVINEYSDWLFSILFKLEKWIP